MFDLQINSKEMMGGYEKDTPENLGFCLLISVLNTNTHTHVNTPDAVLKKKILLYRK